MDVRSLCNDIQSPRLIIAKGLLFALLGLLATGVLTAIMFNPNASEVAIDARATFGVASSRWLLLVLHGLSIWAFCRAYYFGFYVIEKYIDPSFRFAGISSVIKWLVSRRK